MPLLKPKFQFLAILLVLVFFVYYPFKIRVAPEWVVRIVDENDHPVEQADVWDQWQEYSLEAAGHEEHIINGSDGVVYFPPHTMRANFFSRVIGCIGNFQQLGVHASCGAYAYLVVFKCGYGSLLSDVGRTNGDEWRGWSESKK